jgi:hypothetical protein
VLKDFELRTDATVVRYPDRYTRSRDVATDDGPVGSDRGEHP